MTLSNLVMFTQPVSIDGSGEELEVEERADGWIKDPIVGRPPPDHCPFDVVADDKSNSSFFHIHLVPHIDSLPR